LIGIGEWNDAADRQLNKALEQEIIATFEHAEAYGSASSGVDFPAATLFDDVYCNLPAHLQLQLEELQADVADDDDELPTVPFASEPRRAVG
jgi:2-oxoisovalerate dehydrogenase E1 component alpha subunit